MFLEILIGLLILAAIQLVHLILLLLNRLLIMEFTLKGLNIGISLLNGVYSSNEGDCSLRTVAFLFKEFVLFFIKKYKLLKLMKAVIFYFI
jgi:hypothetical protein